MKLQFLVVPVLFLALSIQASEASYLRNAWNTLQKWAGKQNVGHGDPIDIPNPSFKPKDVSWRPNLKMIMDNTFCWRNSYGRGVGVIPTDCGSGNDYDAGLCYPKCNSGYTGVGPVCWQWCPSGFTDNGAFCLKPPPYGRGAGYPAWGMGSCESAYGKGNCEWCLAMIYPKCKDNYYPVGCNICSPKCPSNMGTDIGISCTKKSYGRGVGKIPTSCQNNMQYDAGLCYKQCNSGYHGVGPVCWGDCPASMPTSCGAGCATSASACFNVIKEQIESVFDVALNIAEMIASGGSSSVAKMTAKQMITAIKNMTAAELKAAMKKLVKDLGKDLAEATIEQIAQMGLGNDFDPYALDPTGIANVVKAFNKSVCQ